VFQQQFIDEFLVATKPALRDLILEIMADRQADTATLVVDYDEAGKMIGTSYDGIRKMVAKGHLKATHRGRRVGIALSVLKDFITRNTGPANEG